MTKDEIQRIINATIDSKISTLKSDMQNLRKWRVFDSVTDQFSPVTGASQMIGFFGTNKISQPTTSGAGATFADSGATVVHTASTFDGYTLAQVVKSLRSLGLLK